MGPLPRLQYLQGRVADSADKVHDAEKSYKAAIAADPEWSKPTSPSGGST